MAHAGTWVWVPGLWCRGQTSLNNGRKQGVCVVGDCIMCVICCVWRVVYCVLCRRGDNSVWAVTASPRGGRLRGSWGADPPCPSPPPPKGASVQQLVAKGAGLRSAWAPKAPEGNFCPFLHPNTILHPNSDPNAHPNSKPNLNPSPTPDQD